MRQVINLISSSKSLPFRADLTSAVWFDYKVISPHVVLSSLKGTMCWLKSDPRGIFAHCTSSSSIWHNSIQWEPHALNLSVVPALFSRCPTRRGAALSRAAVGPLVRRLFTPNLVSTQTFHNNPQGSLCAPRVLIYESFTGGESTQPKELMEKCFLSLRIVIFIIMALLPLLRTLKPL